MAKERKFRRFPTPAQLAVIHIAKKQLNLTDENYSDILSGFILDSGEKAASSKQLSYDQAEALIHIFVKLGYKNSRLKYEEYENRYGGFARPGQMRKIEALWMSSGVVREKTPEALNKFIYSIAKVSHITFLQSADVFKVIKAIESLK